ncbi:short-chain fatty acyl-CoA regulator family protein [Kitasatospora sp. CM 4170]|uniref:Short-chain fatty acyl-CoA regulator family protein n=1 Tax=Kitasatospora aburaviensis TaxID=67265 RepID=A0ABW1EYW6_9ACTN|nr:short-chain fatty acyl-CoA regulator family protein [Kitasatospora sp. CM 4170]WNM43487.1 short-chain fatty acyl-CoA regulator family protein [Kitasatospora sp. CM 4170]
MGKAFAGARLRRLREERGLSQAALARLIDLSPSYLNQLEHDARPLTVPVLLRLTEAFGVEAGYFAPPDSARLTAELREALGEQVATGRVTAGDLDELAARLPAVARLLMDLGRSRRAVAEQLAVLAGDRGPTADALTPHEQVREFFYRRRNYIDELDTAAEELALVIGLRRGEVRAVLAERLASGHGVRTVTGSEHLHRYDPRTRVLSLSDRLRPGQQAFRMATQLAYLEHDPLLSELAAQDSPEGSTAWSLTRIGLANHFAAALVLPYTAFHAEAESARYDIEHLADHFGVGYETVCHRLSTLQRPRLRGVPFSFVRVDRAGNVSKRQSATAFHFSRTGGTCPLWNVYEAFAAPGRVHVQVAAMPDGRRYLWTARAVTRSPGGWGRPGKTFAIGLGCEIRHAGRLVYSAGLDLGDESAATPIGLGCKVCERPVCPQRGAPPIGRPLEVDENTSTFVPYRALSD